MRPHAERQRGWKRPLSWLGPALLVLVVAAYLLWKRLRRRPAPPERWVEHVAQPEVPPAAPPAHALAADTPAEGVNPLVALLLAALLTGGIAFALLLLFGGLPPVITEAVFFDRGVFNTYKAGPAPVPVLQAASPEDRLALTVLKREQLNSYGWVSQEEGIAHIPLEQAMALVVAKGLPTRPPAPTLPPPTATPVAAAATVTATPSPTSAAPIPTLNPTAAAGGKQLFSSLGCNTCHPGGEAGTGPSLLGLLGRRVELQGGQTATADEEYIRRSILHPGEQVVAGYSNVMPSFEGQVSDRELGQLIAYIQSLGR